MTTTPTSTPTTAPTTTTRATTTRTTTTTPTTAPTAAPPTETPTTERVLGAPLSRLDGPAKVTGAAPFSTEHPMDDIAYAALTFATIAKGRITAIDTARAEAVPGVLAVITHLNAPAIKPPPKPSLTNLSTLASGTTVNYLNTDQVHFEGQPVAVVVAESIEAAAEAAALIRPTYEKHPAATDFAAALPTAVKQKNSLIQVGSVTKGDALKALGEATSSVDLSFSTPRHQHNAIEPHSTTAVWHNDTQLTVYDGAQNIDWTRRHLAHRFDLPVKDVRVIAKFVGGGFGGKTVVWAGTLLTVLAAKVVQRPVRMMLTREGVYRTTGGRTPSVQRVALGADHQGKLTALIHTSTSQIGRVGGGPEQITSASHDLYQVPNLLIQQSLVTLDSVSNTFMRAPGESIGTFALESAMDELAAHANLDPIEFRKLNEPTKGPATGKAFANRNLMEAFEIGAAEFGWADRNPAPGSMRDGRYATGMGTAAAWHPAWQFQANVTVGINQAADVLVRCASHEMGMGAATAQAQIVADQLGVPVSSVKVEYGDSDLPLGPGAGGSGQTASMAASLQTACRNLTTKAQAIAEKFNVPTAIPLDFPRILETAGLDALEEKVGSETRLGAITGQVKFLSKAMNDRRRWIKAASGAQFCEVRVDLDTGEVRISRWLGVFDIGTVVNAKTAASQLRGGIVMGIGMALSEQTLVDPHTGRIANPSLSEYHVPVHADIPRIDIRCLDRPDPTMPLGVLGAGEVGITGVAAAVANAVFHATGKRVRDLPITVDKLL